MLQLRHIHLLIIVVLSSSFITGCSTFQGVSAVMNDTQSEYIKNVRGREAFEKSSVNELTILCSFYAQTGDLQGALDCSKTLIHRFLQAEDLDGLWSNNLEDVRLVLGTGYVVQVTAYIDLGQFKEAIKSADKAIAFLDKNKLTEPGRGFNRDVYLPYFMRSRLAMYAFKSVALYRMGRVSEANKILAKIQSTMPWLEDQEDVIKNAVKNILSRTYAQMDRFMEAGALFVTDEKISATDIISSRTTFFFSDLQKKTDVGLYFIAKADLEAGRYQRAIQLFKELEGYASVSNDPVLHWMYWFDYAQTFFAMNQSEQAFKKLNKAILVIEEQRSAIKTEAGKIGFVGNKQKVYSLLISKLLDKGKYAEAFLYAERAKSRALVDLLAQKKNIRGGQTVSATLPDKLISSLSSAEQKLALATKTKSTEKQRALIRKKKTDLIQLNPNLASLLTVDVPSLRQIQSNLPEGEYLIEYYGHDDDLFAFTLSRKDIKAVKLNGKNIDKLVSLFRSQLNQPKSSAYKKTGRTLYSRLITPLNKHLKTKSLTIVPHGALHYLPFSALPTPSGHMIDNYALRILPSASVMQFLNKKHKAKGALLVFGNPDSNNKALDPPGAQKEAIAIAKIQPKAQLLLRKKATETAVKQHGGAYKYLHFASHGVFDPETPLASGLLLAKDKQNDGTLTVAELYDLNLHADLVTLSACETALGTITNGDDVIGFTRGFLYAGANSIVSSLWKVDDTATNKLMQAFYKNLKKIDKRSALRLAQLHLKKSSKKHPYYWAAFQLTGAVN